MEVPHTAYYHSLRTSHTGLEQKRLNELPAGGHHDEDVISMAMMSYRKTKQELYVNAEFVRKYEALGEREGMMMRERLQRLLGLVLAGGLLVLSGVLPAAEAATVTVSTFGELRQAITDASDSTGATTILLRDGTYQIPSGSGLYVTADDVTIRSRSGERENVIIQGLGMEDGAGVSHGFLVGGSNVTIEDLTIRNVRNHGIQVQGEENADNLTVRNLVVQNTGEQMIKGSYNAAAPSAGSDGGLVENCLFEYTAGVGPRWYIGGIDVHNGKDWIVRGNTFRFIQNPGSGTEGPSEHAVHFWSDSANTLVERNTIVDCDRGIGFGLGDRGHRGGIIRNNMISNSGTAAYADVGIGLENAPDAQVYNNTIYLDGDYANAVELRFAGTTGGFVRNTLTNKAITDRDGGTAARSSNVTDAAAAWFVDTGTGDLHLASEVAGVVDAGEAVEGLTEDIDGSPRPVGGGYDIGAHEYGGTPAPTATPEPTVTEGPTATPAPTVTEGPTTTPGEATATPKPGGGGGCIAGAPSAGPSLGLLLLPLGICCSLLRNV